MSDFVVAETITKSHQGEVSNIFRSTVLAGDAAYYLVKDPLSAEIAAPRVDSITVVSATGLDIDGGYVWLNFGNGKLTVESTLAAPMIATDTTAALVSSDDFPSPTSFFTAIIGVGLRTEEKVLVTANNTGTDVFTLAGGTYGVQYASLVAMRWFSTPRSIQTSFALAQRLCYNIHTILWNLLLIPLLPATPVQMVMIFLCECRSISW
jgi:hypothetical protein